MATEPRHLVTDTGIAITSMRLASPSRRWDRATSTWTNGATNWFTVTAFRSLAANVHRSVKKGDRVVVTGRVRIRTWERDGRGGTSVEIDAEGLGHDLAWGISNWVRVPRHTGESTAAPGNVPTWTRARVRSEPMPSSRRRRPIRTNSRTTTMLRATRRTSTWATSDLCSAGRSPPPSPNPQRSGTRRECSGPREPWRSAPATSAA
ncbi:single-stranded DNA-binding protein [Curtobacterium flaccumfaciens]|nr:single-stranded DNA-binding protein [Curtobacterium flaccumfaciens]